MTKHIHEETAETKGGVPNTSENVASANVKALRVPNNALALLYVLLNVQLHGAQCRARRNNRARDRRHHRSGDSSILIFVLPLAEEPGVEIFGSFRSQRILKPATREKQRKN
jgi:hypothetical protein